MGEGKRGVLTSQTVKQNTEASGVLSGESLLHYSCTFYLLQLSIYI